MTTYWRAKKHSPEKPRRKQKKKHFDLYRKNGCTKVGQGNGRKNGMSTNTDKMDIHTM
jgi:hypothetical protein